MKNLRYILRFQIQNDGTKDSTIECLKQWFQWPKSEGIKAWPGWLIDDKQHAMMPWRKGVHTAMLSTPNVQGVAFLLLQHKEAFGDKVIGDIRIWNPNSTDGSIKTNDMCLLVEIKDRGT